MKPARLATCLTLLAVVVLLMAAATNALAHEGRGVLVVESRVPTAATVIPYVVRLTWEDDGDPAIDATVTATPIAPDGTVQTPVPMEPIDQDGRYRTTITYPSNGRWTVRFTAVTPTATLDLVEEIQNDATTTSTRAETTSTAAALGDGEEAATHDPDDGGGTSVGNALGLGLLVAIVIGVAIGLARSSRRLGNRT